MATLRKVIRAHVHQPYLKMQNALHHLKSLRKRDTSVTWYTVASVTDLRAVSRHRNRKHFPLSISGYRVVMNGDYSVILVFRSVSIVVVKRPSDVSDDARQFPPVSSRQPGTFPSRHVLLVMLVGRPAEPTQVQHEAADKNRRLHTGERSDAI